MKQVNLVRVNAGNVEEYGFFCSKNSKSSGYRKKLAWLMQRFSEGLQINLLRSESGEDAGFIEYVPGEFAWRPVDAPGYLFIHCIYIARLADRGIDFGTRLIDSVLEDAQKAGKKGVAVICSEGPWLAGKSVFEKNGFEVVDSLGRFELLVKQLQPADQPRLIDWQAGQAEYRGWHLIYAHQCPWHDKAVHELAATAREAGINLEITEITCAREAQRVPCGFGVFALLCDGRLLADHYISKTRFLNILKAEKAATFQP